jgi:hypothetical protein
LDEEELIVGLLFDVLVVGLLFDVLAVELLFDVLAVGLLFDVLAVGLLFDVLVVEAIKVDVGVLTDVLFFKIRERSMAFGFNGNTPAFIKLLTIFVFVRIASLDHNCIKSDGNRAFPITL